MPVKCTQHGTPGIVGKSEFIVAVEGFQGSEKGGRSQHHLLVEVLGSPTANSQEWPWFLTGSRKPRPLMCFHIWLWLFNNIRKKVNIKVSGKIKILMICKGQNMGEKSSQKPFQDIPFDIRILHILTLIS